MSALKFELGNKLRDRVTGLEGITTGYITYLNGCRQWNIHAPVGEDGKVPSPYYYDEQQLELVDEGITKKIAKEKADAEKQNAKHPGTRGSTGGSATQVSQSL